MGGRQLDPIFSDFLSDGINTVRRFLKTDIACIPAGRDGGGGGRGGVIIVDR